jgi:hypothetical protein
MLSGGRSIGQITAYKPLARCGMEELAARQRDIQPRGGILFARNADGEAKITARQKVIDLFQPQQWPGPLHMLTMPGVQWRFERKLLAVRQVGWMRQSSPKGTYFTSCESDRAIYYASVTQMPGLHTPDSKLSPIKPYVFAEMGVKTRFASFFFANIDDMIAHGGWADGWDAVWLDYTGPLTTERLTAIKRFYHQYVRSTLIVTALKARWNEATMRAIERAGGHSHWMRNCLDGEVLHDLEYFDSSPMAQFAVRKVKWRSSLV